MFSFLKTKTFQRFWASLPSQQELLHQQRFPFNDSLAYDSLCRQSKQKKMNRYNTEMGVDPQGYVREEYYDRNQIKINCRCDGWRSSFIKDLRYVICLDLAAQKCTMEKLQQNDTHTGGLSGRLLHKDGTCTRFQRVKYVSILDGVERLSWSSNTSQMGLD